MKNIAFSLAALTLAASPAFAERPGLTFVENASAETISSVFESVCEASGTVYRRLGQGIVCKLNDSRNDVFVTMVWQRGDHDTVVMVYGSGIINGVEVGFNDENVFGLTQLIKQEIDSRA